MKLILDKACNKYGAQMGRRNELPVDVNAPVKLQMQKLRMVDSDYDQGGAYWGCGWGVNHIYCAFADGIKIFVRANNREDAKDSVQQFLINARFYN